MNVYVSYITLRSLLWTKSPPNRVKMHLFEALSATLWEVCVFVCINNHPRKMSKVVLWGEEQGEVSGRQGRRLGEGEGLGMK